MPFPSWRNVILAVAGVVLGEPKRLTTIRLQNERRSAHSLKAISAPRRQFQNLPPSPGRVCLSGVRRVGFQPDPVSDPRLDPDGKIVARN